MTRVLFLTENDPPLGKVVWSQLDEDRVPLYQIDEIFSHLPGDVCPDNHPSSSEIIGEFNLKKRAGERLDNDTLDLDLIFFLFSRFLIVSSHCDGADDVR